jgi:hypothetical protein
MAIKKVGGAAPVNQDGGGAAPVDTRRKDSPGPAAQQDATPADARATKSRPKGQTAKPRPADEKTRLHARSGRAVDKKPGSVTPGRGTVGAPTQSPVRAAPAASTGGVPTPSAIQATSAAHSFVDFAKPDAVFYGFGVKKPVSFGIFEISPSGNPFRFSKKNGNSVFMSFPVGTVPKIAQGKFKAIEFKGIKLAPVLTYNPVTNKLEAGLGGTLGISLGPVPAIVFLNFRTDNLPPGLIDFSHFSGTLSANIGAGISVDQCVAWGLKCATPFVAAIPEVQAAAPVMRTTAAGLEVAGQFANEYAGLGYRVDGTFVDGKLVSIKYHDMEIDPQKFGEDAANYLLYGEPLTGLAALGLNGAAVRILSPALAGRDAKAFFDQMAHYLGTSPGAVVNWYNRQAELNPEWLQRWAVPAHVPVENGTYRTYITHPTDVQLRPITNMDALHRFADVRRWLLPDGLLGVKGDARTYDTNKPFQEPLSLGDIALNAMIGVPEHTMPGLRPEFIEFNNVYLRNHGMKPGACYVLSQCFADLDVGPFLDQTARHLHVSSDEIVNWFNQWDPVALHALAETGLYMIRPDKDGIYKTSPTPQTLYGPFSMQSIEDLVRYAKMIRRPMPIGLSPGSPGRHRANRSPKN